MSTPPDTFGRWLSAARTRRGLTQEQLASLSGVSIRTVRDIEHGRIARPHRASVERLSQVLALPGEDHAGRRAGEAPPRRAEARLSVSVLGPLVVHQGRHRTFVGSEKLRTLLGLLALQPNRMVGRDEVIDVLWGDRPPATAVNLVHTYVLRLRRVTGAGLLRHVGNGYQLALTAEQSDVLRFAELAARAAGRAAADDPDGAARLYAQALDLWRGPLLAGLDQRLREIPAAVGIHQLHLTVVLRHADLALRLGDHDAAAAQLRTVAPDQPLHEGLHARLMLALAGSGQQAAAVHLFAELRSRLADELGMRPGAELQDAYLRVLRQTVLPAPSGATAAPVPAQLPAGTAVFVGRAARLAELDDVLARREAGRGSATVMITGMPGVGKTALALHWAHRVRDRFPDGQLYVNLRAHGAGPPLSPFDALSELLHGLGTPSGRVPARLEQAAGSYRTMVADRAVLVLLDDAAGPAQIAPLLPGGRRCLVVVTSRNRNTGLVARHGAEHVELGLPDAAEATGLLTAGVPRGSTPPEPGAIAELVSLCGRLPLALRFAAARLAADPDRGVDDHLATIGGDLLGWLTTPDEPHAGVRAALERSHRALPEPARRTLRLLGHVPHPDFPVDAVTAVTPDGRPAAEVAADLDRLVDSHLLDRRPNGRYAVHPLVRRYAAGLS
ncbi:MAG TPA: BTAD domain-containing putative transcriptional regulator [Pseudonocardiaceae bacterium]